MPESAGKAVFLSYASQDTEAAKRICEALRAAGVEVWFDQSELRGGDQWDTKIKKQIRECALFVPVISANTQARAEGYFRREWKLAVERMQDMADHVTFLVPVVLDDTKDREAHVPETFLKVQWTRLPAGEVPTAFVARMRILVGGTATEETPRAQPGATSANARGPAGRRSPVALGAAALAIVAAIGAALFLAKKSGRPAVAPAQPIAATPAPPAAPVPASTAPAATEKSILVLPLENLSPDPENAYFTDGMHREIISTLQRISDLRVVSRDSSLLLKRGTAPLGELAKKAGATNVVTGSVRRAGDRVRIQLELRRASDEVLLWSSPNYDRELKDVFAVQSDIADEVARVLQAREDKSGLRGARFLTKNPEALNLLLKGNSVFNDRANARSRSGGDYVGTVEQSIQLLEQALTLDPSFVSAAEEVAIMHVFAFNNATNQEQQVRHANAAKRWAETAVQLMPGGAADSTLGYYLSRVEFNNVRGMQLAQNTTRVLPNDINAINRVGIALRGMGRRQEAVDYFRRCVEAEPLFRVGWQNMLGELSMLRRRSEFEAVLKQASDISSGSVSRGVIANARFRLDGSVPDLDQLTWFLRTRRFEEAIQRADGRITSSAIDDLQRLTALRDKWLALHRLHREDEAKSVGNEALEWVKQLAKNPDVDPSAKNGRMATALTMLGDASGALAAARRYAEAVSLTGQADERWRREIESAQDFALVGRIRECVDLLAKLLRVPSGITVPMLKVDPVWDDVREDTGFKVLLADPKNSAPL